MAEAICSCRGDQVLFMDWIVVFSVPTAAEHLYHSFSRAVALHRPPASLSLGAAELGRTHQLVLPTWVGD